MAQHVTTQAVAPLEEFRQIPLEQLVESKSNPRRHWDKKALDELTASVKSHGVVEPIIVRPSKTAVDGPRLIATAFEIVVGARRYRASKAANKPTVPAIVRMLTDTQVLEIQTIENLQREDVHPLDEALGYQALMEKAKYDVEAIAAKIGRSASYIYQRLKLTSLIDKAKDDFFDGKITAGHAILIARLQPTDQAEALKQCTGTYPLSVRRLADWIDSEIHLDLHSAGFKKDDATLLPKAGPCTTCPKRTGFQPALFPDIAKKDTCTDPACFHAKLAEFGKRQKTDMEQSGHDVVEISESWSSHGRERKKGVLHESQYRPAGKITCDHTKIGIFIDGEIGKTLKVCTQRGNCKVHDGYGSRESRSISSTGRNLAQQRKYLAREAACQRAIKAVMPCLKTLDDRDYRFICEAFVAELWHDRVKQIVKRHDWQPGKASYGGQDFKKPLIDHINKSNGRALQHFLLELAMSSALCCVDKYALRTKEDGATILAAVAKRHGVRLETHENEALRELKEKDKKRRDRLKKQAKAQSQTSAKKRKAA